MKDEKPWPTMPPAAPMRYDVMEHGSLPGVTVLLDGGKVDRVVAYDIPDGWVERHCDRDVPGHGEPPHMNPAPHVDDVCLVRYSGLVQVEKTEDLTPTREAVEV